MTLVEGEELQRLWTLVSELSSQLSANQQLCQSLQAQADELKGQALHSGTGYALRRFNTDVSKEKFESELEKVNVQLVMENQTLSHENRQMNLLLREYESTLEQIMSKFRSFSHATQQHTLALTSHYETLLESNAYDAQRAELEASTAFSEHLAKLGNLVRLALRDTEGEGVDDDNEEAAASSSASSAKTEQKRKPHHAYNDPRWHGTGGYTGSQGDPDSEASQRALEAKTEEERLRHENTMLRELLRISADVTPETARQLGISLPQPPSLDATAAGWGASSAKLSLGQPRGSRKSISGSEGVPSGGDATETRTSDSDQVTGATAEGDRNDQNRSEGSAQAAPYRIEQEETSDIAGDGEEAIAEEVAEGEEGQEEESEGDFKAIEPLSSEEAAGQTSQPEGPSDDASAADGSLSSDIADALGNEDAVNASSAVDDVHEEQIDTKIKKDEPASESLPKEAEERRDALLDETEKEVQEAATIKQASSNDKEESPIEEEAL